MGLHLQRLAEDVVGTQLQADVLVAMDADPARSVDGNVRSASIDAPR